MMMTSVNDRTLALNALHALWSKERLLPKQRTSGQIYAQAVYLRYFKDMTLEEIAQEMDYTKERVRQLIIRGLSVMKQHLSRKYRVSTLSDALDA